MRPRVLVSSAFPPSLSYGRISLAYASERRETIFNYPIAQASGLQLRDCVPRRPQEEPHAAMPLPGAQPLAS